MKRYSRFLLFSLFLCGFCMVAFAQDASSLLEKAATAYRNSNGLTAEFSIVSQASRQQSASGTEGTISMRGEKFLFTTSESHVWFNGRTQWVYMKQNEEVNVSNPSGDELQSTNPMLLLGNYRKNYKASTKGSSIVLTPRVKSEIAKITLQINRQNNLPSLITLTMRNRTVTTIRISRIRTNVNQNDAIFTFNPKNYPKAEVVDLR